MPLPSPVPPRKPNQADATARYEADLGNLWLQVLATVVLQSILTHLFVFITSPSPLNLVWLGGGAFLIGIFANRAVERIGMAIALLPFSLLTVLANAAIFGWSY